MNSSEHRVGLERPNWQAKITSFFAMVRKELLIVTRYRVEFFTAFGQLVAMLSIVTFSGVAFSGGVGAASPTISGVTIYGFVLYIFLSNVLWAIGYNIRIEQTEGTLEQLYLSPASKFASLVSRVFNQIVWTGALALGAVLTVSLLIGTIPLKNPGLGLYLLALSLSGTFGTSFAFAALTLRIKDTALPLGNAFQLIFMIFCANFFPFSALPEFARRVSAVLPQAYAVDAFRSTLLGFPDGFPELASIEVEIVIVTLYGLLMPLLGWWLYRMAESHARRTGSLSEY